MNWPFRTQLSALLTLLVVLLATLHGPHAGGSVICVGADGHVEVEPAVGEACSEEQAEQLDAGITPAHVARPVWSASGDAHCGECTDIPYLAHHDLDRFDSRVPAVSLHARVPRSLSHEDLLGDVRIHHPLCNAPISHASSTIGLKKSISLQR